MERDLKAVKALQASDGWRILREIMEREQLQAARNMATPSLSHDANIHFMRGAIWAAEQLINVPDRVINHIENELMMLDHDQGEPK